MDIKRRRILADIRQFGLPSCPELLYGPDWRNAMTYLESPETDDETRYLTTEANDAMADVRAYLREIASIDDDTLDEMDDAEVSSLAREFVQWNRSIRRYLQ